MAGEVSVEEEPARGAGASKAVGEDAADSAVEGRTTARAVAVEEVEEEEDLGWEGAASAEEAGSTQSAADSAEDSARRLSDPPPHPRLGPTLPPTDRRRPRSCSDGREPRHHRPRPAGSTNPVP